MKSLSNFLCVQAIFARKADATRGVTTFILASLLILAMDSFAQKQDTVLMVAGDNFLQSHLLTNYSASYDFFSLKDGVETLVGSLEDHFQIFPIEKQALRICKIKFGTNSILDSGLCELKGLAPIYHRSVQTKKTMNLAFRKDKVEGNIIFKNESENKIEKVDYKTSTPPFDSFYEDIIAKTINLKLTEAFKFPEYIYEKGGIVWSVGEILKNENPSEKVVKFYELNAQKEIVRTTTFLVNEATREILRREYVMGSNKIIMKKKA